ncbi:hypothetical protein pb186bvf_016120 [Paramecium bursaria]
MKQYDYQNQNLIIFYKQFTLLVFITFYNILQFLLLYIIQIQYQIHYQIQKYDIQI